MSISNSLHISIIMIIIIGNNNSDVLSLCRHDCRAFLPPSHSKDDRKNRGDKGSTKKKDGPQKVQKEAMSKKGILNFLSILSRFS